jgi:hypothetical protein
VLVLAAVVTLTAACSAARAEPHGSARAEPAAGRPEPITVRFGPGRQAAAFTVRRGAGVILAYRLSAPAGAVVRASVRLPGITAALPLEMSGRAGAHCTRAHGRRLCAIPMEACPMPAGRWRLRIVKRSGPAGAVRLTFRVARPPAQAA